MPELPSSCDCCIVGGGPAGLAAAIALRQRGLSAAVFDCAVPPIDKACGEGLMPGTLTALAQLGVALPTNSGYPLEGIGFTDGGVRVFGRFRRGAGIGLRRTVLHRLLAARAESLGIQLHWGARKVELVSEGITVGEYGVTAKWVIGADGQNSRIRQVAVLDKPAPRHTRFGFRRHYRLPPWSKAVEIFWGPGLQIYVTPVAPDEVGVAVLTADPAMRVESAVHCFPELQERLSSAEPSSDERGALTFSRMLVDVSRGRLALIGDAAGSVDAITGEGLGLSFRHALALADAVAEGDLEQYQRRHTALSRRPRVMAKVLLSLGRFPAVRQKVMLGFSRWPDAFDALLAIHTGERWDDAFSILTNQKEFRKEAVPIPGSRTRALPLKQE